METTVRRIAGELGVGEEQIEAVFGCWARGRPCRSSRGTARRPPAGSTIAHLRAIEERLQQVRELDERRGFILKAVRRAGAPHARTPDGRGRRPTRGRASRTSISRSSRSGAAAPTRRASPGSSRWPTCCSSNPHLSPGGGGRPLRQSREGRRRTALAALDGARWILLERFSDEPRLLESLRQHVAAHATLQAKVVEGRQEKGAKFAEYFAFSRDRRGGAVAPRAGAVPRPQGRRAAARAGRCPRRPPCAAPRGAAVAPHSSPRPRRRARAASTTAPAPGRGARQPRCDAEHVREAPSVPEQMIARVLRDRARRAAGGRLADRRRAPGVEDESLPLRAGGDRGDAARSAPSARRFTSTRAACGTC